MDPRFENNTQYFLSERDIGKPRALSCFDKLTDLNNYVAVSVHTGTITTDFICKFNVRFFAHLISLASSFIQKKKKNKRLLF